MKEIKLTQGYIALVDDEDFEYLNQWKWHFHKSKNVVYAVRTVRVNGVVTKVQMHRQIMGLKKENKINVDHIDHNGLNNQKENLRLATHRQNVFNTSPKKGTSSKYKGVHICKSTNRWRVKVQKDGRCYHIGYFATEELAAQAYNNAVGKYHGEFAYLNTIPA